MGIDWDAKTKNASGWKWTRVLRSGAVVSRARAASPSSAQGALGVCGVLKVHSIVQRQGSSASCQRASRPTVRNNGVRQEGVGSKPTDRQTARQGVQMKRGQRVCVRVYLVLLVCWWQGRTKKGALNSKNKWESKQQYEMKSLSTYRIGLQLSRSQAHCRPANNRGRNDRCRRCRRMRK